MMDTSNKFLVGSNGNDIVFILPVDKRMSKEDALLLAAWLVVLADMEGTAFPPILQAVQNS